jgi:hypothetical protein
MKSKFLPLLLVPVALSAVAARAQVTVPSPAPVLTSTMSAPASVNRIIYAPRLPSPTELSNVAAAQGLGIERIDQTDVQITVTYRASNGQVSTVAYQLLPDSSTQNMTTVGQSAPARTVVYSQPAPTVVYTQAAPVVYSRPAPYYYYDDPFYYPWRSNYGYYNPVSVSLGFGYYGGYYGGRGGYYRNGGYNHRGGHGHRR